MGGAIVGGAQIAGQGSMGREREARAHWAAEAGERRGACSQRPERGEWWRRVQQSPGRGEQRRRILTGSKGQGTRRAKGGIKQY